MLHIIGKVLHYATYNGKVLHYATYNWESAEALDFSDSIIEVKVIIKLTDIVK